MDEQRLMQRAEELGLTKIAKDYKGELEKALESAATLSGRLPPDMHWTEEPAHVFSLVARKDRRS